jgi:DNA polymerase-3 subunit delta'
VSNDPDIESDQQAGCLHPRQRYDLFGHESAEQNLADAWASGKMHHAWLLTGPRGVGKASLAWRAARRILGANAMPEHGALGSSPRDPVCQLLEAGATPDLLILRKPWDDKRKRWRAEITVDEARKVSKFFEMSAAGDGWRVCIVDSVDDMNTNASNALLKTLEEPPARGVIILVSHSPGRLTATIRSRCRQLRLQAPSIEKTAEWLMASGGPSVSGEALIASRMAHGAPGRGLALAAAGGVPMASDVEALVALGNKAGDNQYRALADRVSLKNRESLREIFYECLSDNMRARAKERAQTGLNPSSWLDAWRDLNVLVREANDTYLDPKQTALAALGLVRDASRKEEA